MAAHLMKSDPNELRSQRERCRWEIEECERLLKLGHPDVDGLCLALADWSAELRWLDGCKRSDSQADQHPCAGGEPGAATPAGGRAAALDGRAGDADSSRSGSAPRVEAAGPDTAL